MSMNHILSICCLVLLFVCGYLLFILIDQSVTLDHMNQRTHLIEQKRDMLLRVANITLRGKSKMNVRQLVQEGLFDTEIFEKGKGQLVANQVSFFFENDTLTKVSVGNP